MNKSDVEEMLSLIEKDPELKSKFAVLLASIIENDFSVKSKINETVNREAKRRGITAGG